MIRGVLQTSMSLYHLCALCLRRPEEGIGSPELELQMLGAALWCWKLNPDPLQKSSYGS